MGCYNGNYDMDEILRTLEGQEYNCTSLTIQLFKNRSYWGNLKIYIPVAILPCNGLETVSNPNMMCWSKEKTLLLS